MSQYKVLKDFPSSDGGYLHEVGTIYKPTQSKTRTENLLKFGFIEEIPEQPKTVWDLEEGDKFWFYTPTDKAVYASLSKWYSTYKPEREIGDVFLTKEEADIELARRKAKQILLQDTKGFKPKPKDKNQVKYGVFYVQALNEIEVGFRAGTLENRIYFATKADAEASIKTHEKEWKIFLGVEGDE